LPKVSPPAGSRTSRGPLDGNPCRLDDSRPSWVEGSNRLKEQRP
jgi:hypothetical protein